MNSRFPPMAGAVMEPVAIPTEPLNQQPGLSGSAFPPSSSPSLFAFGGAGTVPATTAAATTTTTRRSVSPHAGAYHAYGRGGSMLGSPGLTGSSSGSAGSPETTNRLGLMSGQVLGTGQARIAGGSPPFSGGSSLLVSTSSWRETRERFPSPGSRTSSVERARIPDYAVGAGTRQFPNSSALAPNNGNNSSGDHVWGSSCSLPLLASLVDGSCGSFTAPAPAGACGGGGGAGAGIGGAAVPGRGPSPHTEAGGGDGSAVGFKSESRLRSPASPVLAARLLRSDVTEALNSELEAIRDLRKRLASVVEEAEDLGGARLPGSANAEAAREERVSKQDSDAICPRAYFEQVLNAIREVLAVLREDSKAQVDLTPVLLGIKHSTNEVVDAFNAKNPSDVDFSQLLKAVQASRRQVILPPNFARCGATKATYGFGPSVWSCCGRKVDESTGSHDCLTCPGRTGLPPQSEDEASPTGSTSRRNGGSDTGFTMRIVACGQNDCPEMVNVEELEEHRRHHCPYRKIQCSNEGCCAWFAPSEKASHEAACGHGLQTCHCGLEVKMKDLASHLRECSLRRVSCPYEGCDKVLSASELSSHLDGCPHRKVNCKNPGCTALCKQHQLPAHEEACEFRKGGGRGPTFAKFPQLNFQSVRGGGAEDSPSGESGSPNLQAQSDGGLQNSPRSPSPSPGTPQWGSPQGSPLGKPHKTAAPPTAMMMGIPEGAINVPDLFGGASAPPPAPPPRVVEKKTPSYITLDKIRSKLKAASYTNGGADWGKLFREQDKDHSGSLDWPEFLSMCRRALRMPEPEPQLKHIFDNLDVEKAGAINIEDLLGFIDDPIRRMRARMRSAMQEQGLFHLRDTLTEFDEDGNGLDWQEFRGLCRHKLKMFDPDDQLRLVFAGLDSDKSGTISPGELQRFLFADKEGKDENTFRANRVPGALPHSLHLGAGAAAASQSKVPSHTTSAAMGPTASANLHHGNNSGAGGHHARLSVPGQSSAGGQGDSPAPAASESSSGSPPQASSPRQGAGATSPAASPPPSPKDTAPAPPSTTIAVPTTPAAQATPAAPAPAPAPASAAAASPSPSSTATASATATPAAASPPALAAATTISLPAPKAVPSPSVPSPPPSPKAVPKISVKAAPALPKQTSTTRRGSQMTELFSDSEDPSPNSNANNNNELSPASSGEYETASASVSFAPTNSLGGAAPKASGKAPAGSPPGTPAKARLSQTSVASSSAASSGLQGGPKRLAAPKGGSPKRGSVATSKAATPGKARASALQVPGATPKRGTGASPTRR